MKKPVVLVTGGAGMIGSNLVKDLRSRGHRVLVADNLWRGRLENLLDCQGRPVINLRRDFYRLDLRNAGALERIRIRPDVVVHLADIVAGIGYVFRNEGQIFRDNLLINTHTFAWVRKIRPRILVYVGTACSFPQKLQMSRKARALREEQLYPAQPESAYGWSKLMGTYEADLLGRETGIRVSNLIFHNVYGTPCDVGPRSQVIPALALRAVRYPREPFVVWGSGKQGRAFLHVDDAVRAIRAAMGRGFGVGPIQIGPGHCTSIRQIAETMVKISGKKIKIRYDRSKPEGDQARCADFSKARKVLGWHPKLHLEEGLGELYRWVENKMGPQPKA